MSLIAQAESSSSAAQRNTHGFEQEQEEHYGQNESRNKDKHKASVDDELYDELYDESDYESDKDDADSLVKNLMDSLTPNKHGTNVKETVDRINSLVPPLTPELIWGLHPKKLDKKQRAKVFRKLELLIHPDKSMYLGTDNEKKARRAWDSK
jgi:hypothetical protein